MFKKLAAAALACALLTTPAVAQQSPDASQAQDLSLCAGAVAAVGNLDVVNYPRGADGEGSPAFALTFTYPQDERTARGEAAARASAQAMEASAQARLASAWTDGPRNAIELLADRWDDTAMDALLLVVPQARANGHGGRGDFHMDKLGRLTRRAPGKIAPFVFTGVQLFSRRLLADPPEGAFSTMVFWERAIAKGRLFGMSHGGDWFDVGSPASIPLVEAALSDG